MSDENAVVVQAAARLLISAVLDLLQEDPHSWSDRPCPTCKPISAIIGRPFGCYVYAAVKNRAAELAKAKP